MLVRFLLHVVLENAVRITGTVKDTHHKTSFRNGSVENHISSFWNAPQGRRQVLALSSDAGIVGANFTPYGYGSFAGYTAIGIAVDPDSHSHVLWTVQGGVALWGIAPGAPPIGYPYSAPSSYTPVGLSTGPDNHVHVLWNVGSGGNTLWDLAPGASPTAAVYNPGGGWAAIAVSAAP